MQQAVTTKTDSQRYAKAVEVSKRIRWEIDRDVIKGREFDFTKKFLPDGLSKVDRLDFLSASEQRLLSQIQGRTYANIFGLVERFIAAKVLELSREHWLGDQNALEAMVRFGDEEIKHQELFRRVERMSASGMAPGYNFLPEPNAVAALSALLIYKDDPHLCERVAATIRERGSRCHNSSEGSGSPSGAAGIRHIR